MRNFDLSGGSRHPRLVVLLPSKKLVEHTRLYSYFVLDL
jgi:hypothetical protein